MLREGGRYYLFGEFKDDHGNEFNGFSCYSSTDLVDWRFERIALPVQKDGRLGPNRVGERPKVMKSPKTGEFVMFMHTDDIKYKDPCVGYATSNTINGVYTFRGALEMNGSPIRKWDMGVFQDDDGTGYLITHSGNLYRLHDDYKSIDEQIVKDMTGKCEAPAIFKRDGVYYWLGSELTGWERNDNYYFTANSLNGPWKYRGHFAPKGSLTWNSQTTFVIPITGEQETTYMFMGDRWAFPRQNSAATYVWQPLEFKGDAISLPTYRESWKIDPASGSWKPASLQGEMIDDATEGRIVCSGEWKAAERSGGFKDTRSARKDDEMSFAFTGSQIGLYGVARPDGGFGRVEVLDKAGKAVVAAVIETYCAYPESSLKFLSPVLPHGDYQLKLTVLGEHFTWTTKSGKVWGSTGDFVSLDQLIIVK